MGWGGVEVLARPRVTSIVIAAETRRTAARGGGGGGGGGVAFRSTCARGVARRVVTLAV